MTICNLRTDRQQEVFDYSEITTYWNRTCHEGRRRSHWREAMPDEWDRIGRVHSEMLREQWPEVGEGGLRWLEWGCGGGANAVMLAAISRLVYCVDISPPSLESLSREMVARTQSGFVTVRIDVENPEGILDAHFRQADGFLSTSTFQHFPSKNYTERVVQLIRWLVRPGGYVFVQIRRDCPRNFTVDAAAPYDQRAMYATVYHIFAFRDLLEAHGVHVEKIKNIDRGQYSYFFGRVRHAD